MRKTEGLVFSVVLIGIITSLALGQVKAPSDKEVAEAKKAFEKGNSLFDKRKPDEALVYYKKALAVLPDEPAILFNTGVAAYTVKDYSYAAERWNKLKLIAPLHWQNRERLVQVYQALGKLPERDAERAELMEMWKKGTPSDLKAEALYCRDQFEVKNQTVVVFEHFELKGERALRYAFLVLKKGGIDEDFRISLGSYNVTNSVWRATKNPPPKEGERLFHLDAYYSGGHATLGMYFPEPTYDDIRRRVIEILEKKEMGL